MNKKLKISIPIVILLIIFCGLFYVYKAKKQENKPPFSISSIQFTSESKQNVYDFMEKLKNEGKINFKEKTYTGMGKFIEELNGIKNNGDKNWIYYVNGKKASIGVSNYKINIGDIVSWKYEEENF